MRERDFLPDWRNAGAYTYTEKLTRAGWAWEFLRRNSAFQEDYARVVEASGPRKIKRTSVREMQALAPWGVTWCDPPHVSALDAIVFWQPRVCTDILDLQVSALATDCQTDTVLRETVAQAVKLRSPGCRHLLLCDGLFRLQLRLRGQFRLNGRLVMPVTFPRSALKARLRLLSCFHEFLHTGKLAAKYFPKDPRRLRFLMVLRALDGENASASHREIAVALFGLDRVKASWNDPRGHMRDNVRRALKRGRTLMKGGYVRLLR